MYLKGRYEWGKLVPSANALALQYYREAVAQDPDYAVAWAGIAHLLAISRVTVGARVEHVKDEARKALETAMAIDPDLAEVQYAKGYIDYFIDADATAAEAAARRAIALDPNNAIAHMFLGILLSEQGSYVEAMDLMRRARELDPLFSLMFANSSNVAWHAGDGEAALEFAKQAIAISPENWAGYLHMGNSNLALGDFPAAARAFADAERLSGGQSAPLAALGYTLARMGQEGEARSILAELESRSGQGASPVDLASVYAGLGEFDLAFDSLYEGLAMDEVRVDWLAHDLTLLPLHADVRFAALLRCEPGSCQQSALQPEPERL